MYIAHSQLAHDADVRRYRPGQEDTTRRFLSSMSSDAGTWHVLQEPQEDPAMYQVHRSSPWKWLRAIAARRLATQPARAAGRETDRRGAGVPDRSDVLPSRMLH